MQIIRELKVTKAKNNVVGAKFYRGADGLVYFKYDADDDSKMECLKEFDIAHKWTCFECKHCCERRDTNNDAKVLRPFSPCSHMCDRWKKRDKEDKYDIVFRVAGAGFRSLCCSYFEPKYNLPDWNVNQFIDVENSCELPKYRHVTGFSYKDTDGLFKQIPFTFDVKLEQFEKGVVGIGCDDKLILMHNVTYWTDGFKIDGRLYKGLDNYIKYHNITDEYIIKCIKNFKPSKLKEYDNVVFDLETKWFLYPERFTR